MAGQRAATGDDGPRADPRCRARTPEGGRCRKVPAPGRRRCRLHAGGAPAGNRNAWKHGYCSRSALEERRDAADRLRGMAALTELVRRAVELKRQDVEGIERALRRHGGGRAAATAALLRSVRRQPVGGDLDALDETHRTT